MSLPASQIESEPRSPPTVACTCCTPPAPSGLPASSLPCVRQTRTHIRHTLYQQVRSPSAHTLATPPPPFLLCHRHLSCYATATILATWADTSMCSTNLPVVDQSSRAGKAGHFPWTVLLPKLLWAGPEQRQLFTSLHPVGLCAFSHLGGTCKQRQNGSKCLLLTQ